MEIKVSIIIPFKKKNPYLEECLHHISLLEFKNFEVILLPDSVIPAEAGIQSSSFPFPLKTIETGAVGPAKKRDLGCQHSQGSILAFIDDDAYPDSRWLTAALEHFKNQNVAAVTGPAATPGSDSFWQKASGFIYSNRYVGGPCAYRYIPKETMEVSDAASVNLLVRKSDYIKVGGFNTHYYPGEDTKLCLDFKKILNKKIMYEPKALVWHHRRPLFLPHLKQVSQYALHRGFFVKKFPGNSLKISYFLPTFFLLYMVMFILSLFSETFHWGFLAIPLIGYSFVLLEEFLKYTNIRLSLVSILGSLLTHLTYGVYFIKGLLSSELKR